MPDLSWCLPPVHPFRCVLSGEQLLLLLLGIEGIALQCGHQWLQ